MIALHRPASWVAILCLTVGLTASAPAQVKVRSSKVAMSSAKNYIQQRVFDKAFEMLEIALQLKPDYHEARFMIGALHAELDSIDQMNEQFNLVLAEKKGQKYLKKGVKTAGASNFMRNGIAFTRETLWRQSFNKGVRSLNAGKIDDALESFNVAVRVDPTVPGSYSAMGKVYLGMGRDSLQTAETYYDKALAIDSTLVEPYADLGIAFLNNGRFAEAETKLVKAHELKPENISICRALASAQWALNKKEAANATAEKALAVAPDDPKVLSLVGGLLTDMREFGRAVVHLEKALDLEPESPDIKFNLANAYLGNDMVEEAEGLFVKSIETDPNDHQALYQLGSIYDKSKRFDDAISMFERVTSLKPQWKQGWDALYKAYAHKSAATEGEVAREAAQKAEEALNVFNALEGSGE